MKKILKTLLVIIVVIGLIMTVITIVKFVKLNSIYKKADDHLKYESYYLKIIFSKEDNENVVEAYYKDGTSKLIASNGVYTWTNGERAYLIDEDNSCAYILSTTNNFALVSYNMFASSIQGYNKDFVDRLFLAINPNTSVKSEKIDDIKFYCITTKENKATKKVWVQKDTGKIEKSQIDFSNGETFYYKYELTFNEVNFEELKLPDLTGYTLINGETGNILAEKFNLE